MHRPLNPSMINRLLCLAILAGVPLASAAPSGAAVEDLAGQGALASVSQGILRGRATSSAWTLQVDGDLNARVVDDYFDILQSPLPPPVGPINFHNRTEEEWRSHSNGHLELVAVDPDAVLLVLPVQGDARIQTDGEWQARADAAQRLEESHVFTPNSTAPYYYAYETLAAVNWTTTAPATWTATGSFEVYAWGLTFTVRDAQGERTVRTGAWSAAEGRFGYREHNAFAILRVEGDLHAEIAGDQDLHAQEIQLAPQGPVGLTGRGVVPVDDATYALDGPATLRGGTYSLHRADHGLVLDVRDAAGIAGVGVSRLDIDQDRILILIAGALAVGLFLLLAFGFAARWGWLGSYAVWLERADQSSKDGRLARAAFYARMACLLDPECGEALFVRARIHAGREKAAAALRDYGAAYRLLPDGKDQGVAAFEASRLEALAGHAAEAAVWLLKALDHDESLLQRAHAERDFAAVLKEPAFRGPLAGRFGLGAAP